MSTSAAILLTAFALSIASFLVKRRDADKIWTAGRAHALDPGIWDFAFSLSFPERLGAETYLSRLKHPSSSARIEQASTGRWVVRGSATSQARGSWYRAVLADWTSARAGISGADESIVATAAKPGVGTGFVLATR